MNREKKSAINPTRSENYPEWYQQVIKAADLAESSAVRGCMVIKPWGYALWENIQKNLDAKFKETGHHNVYFPLLIPLNFLQKEADHVEGFAKECAVVTHRRLRSDKDGKLVPDGELDEPYIIRPTSETIIGASFAKWIKSYRDLPLLINQWANVMRWEMRTRMFLRTSEFLWQEGHTAHATEEDARQETLKMLRIYQDFAGDFMAMDLIVGEKSASERFPGAVATYSIEALMQDNKALQAGTSHFLGQNFSRAQNIKFLNNLGEEEFAWTTSWGVSTRLIGALIMSHSDDDGLVLPPRLAPTQVIILPILKKSDTEGAVLEYAEKIAQEIRAHKDISVLVDKRDVTGGGKHWEYIKKGVPLILEIGPKDREKDSICFTVRTDIPRKKSFCDRNEFIAKVPELLENIQKTIFNNSQKRMRENTHEINSIEELETFFAPKSSAGFAYAYVSDGESSIRALDKLKASIRCIPLDGPSIPGKCLFSGETMGKRVVVARSY